jgi:hypothetical protein
MMLIRWMGAFGRAADLRSAVEFELDGAGDREVAAEPCLYGSSLIARPGRVQIGLVMDDKGFRRGFLADAWTVKDDASMRLRPTRNHSASATYRDINRYAAALKRLWAQSSEWGWDYGHGEVITDPRPVGVAVLATAGEDILAMAEELRARFFPETTLVKIKERRKWK